ncbi:FAD-dependent oxidoreductase [Mesorhizobium sp. M0088]|uniref:FAD-dependent oxidoreductase n=1 Tax=Mesorhizobium sp. M0088 TaxID=2956873 RepID=UPI00333C057D
MTTSREEFKFNCGVRITQIQHNDGQTVVQTERDGAFGADLVIAGIGAIPNIALPEAAGLRVDNGILVNERLETKTLVFKQRMGK